MAKYHNMWRTIQYLNKKDGYFTPENYRKHSGDTVCDGYFRVFLTYLNKAKKIKKVAPYTYEILDYNFNINKYSMHSNGQFVKRHVSKKTKAIAFMQTLPSFTMREIANEIGVSIPSVWEITHEFIDTGELVRQGSKDKYFLYKWSDRA